MIEQALVEQITRLPAPARRELIVLIERSLNHEPIVPTQDERAAALHRLFGALSNNQGPLTDDEWKEDHMSSKNPKLP